MYNWKRGLLFKQKPKDWSVNYNKQISGPINDVFSYIMQIAENSGETAQKHES